MRHAAALRHAILALLLPLASVAATNAQTFGIIEPPDPALAADLVVRVFDDTGAPAPVHTEDERRWARGGFATREPSTPVEIGDDLRLLVSPTAADGRATNEFDPFPEQERLADGAIRHRVRAAGTYVVAVVSDAHTPVEQRVTVTAGSTTTLDFRLGPNAAGTELRFGLSTPTGGVYGGVSSRRLYSRDSGLLLWREEYRGFPYLPYNAPTSDACMRIAIGPGTYSYEAISLPLGSWHGPLLQPARYAPARGTVELIECESTTIAPRFAPGGNVTLTVICPDGFEFTPPLGAESLPADMMREMFLENDGVLVRFEHPLDHLKDSEPPRPYFDLGLQRIPDPRPSHVFFSRAFGPWVIANRTCTSHEALPTGTWRLVIEAGATLVEREIVIVDGETTEVVVEVSR